MWKKIIVIVILVVLIFVALFLTRNVKKIEAPVVEQPKDEQIVKTLNVKHQYKDGTHTFVGDFDLPNPCYTYNSIIEDSNDPNQKILKITLDSKDDGKNICITAITKATYSASYKGPKDITFKGFINSEEYKLNIFEIPEDIDINKFEIFTKG